MVGTKYLQNLWNERGLRFHGVCYFAYIAFGGFCFFLIEGDREMNNYGVLMEAKETFLSKNPCASNETMNELWEKIDSVLVRAASSSNEGSKPLWTYSQSVLFAASVVTTVGYGQVAPESEIGKITCVIYALIGIKLHTALLHSFVNRLMKFSRALRKTISHIASNCVSSSETVEIIHQIVITSTVVLAFFVLPAFVFCYLEKDWNYLDALYFCIITLKTVGLGDYVPSEDPDQPYEFLYRIGVTVYIITGIMAMQFLSAHIADFRNGDMRDQKQDTETTPIIKKYVSVSYGSIV